MLAIYGGTFDPVHYGHLRTALEVTEALGLAEMHLVPCGHPPHRDPPFEQAEARYRLLNLAIRNEPRLSVDRRELDRPGPSYMVDTLRSLRSERGDDAPLMLVVGWDAFRGFPSWHRWLELFELAHVVVMTRPGQDEPLPDALAAEVAKRGIDPVADWRCLPNGTVQYLAVTPLGISSSLIRDIIRRGHSARFLLPDAVWDAICAERLYAPN